MNLCKKIGKSIAIAFSMYSKIPMVQFEWKEEDMRYSMCFFPLVGIVIGLLSWCWWLFCQQFGIGKMCFAFVGLAIILLVTGGIHMDGYMDTMDALHSYGSREKKLEILKDSHIGAFAVIMTVLYVLIAAGAYSEIKNYSVMASFCGSYFLSRIFSAIAVVSFPCAKKEGTLYMFADAAQAAGNIKINLKETDIDILIFAGHKSLYGLFGVGGFATNSRIFERDKKLNPVIFGGNGEDSLNLGLPETGISKYEVGSLNVPAIGALKCGIDSIKSDFNEIRQHEDKMFRYLLEEIEKMDGIIIFQKPETEEEFENHIAVISTAFEKYASDDAGTILDGEYNIAVRTGYHCAPLVHDVIGSKKYGGTIRISIGRYTTKEDIDRLVSAFEDMR